MTGTETIIGIDVSKAYLDLWVRPGGRAWRCDYGEAELSEVVLELSRLEPDGIIVEATGGLEVPLVAELSAADLPVVVVNPRQVREFGRASGRLAKTTGWTPSCWRTLEPRCGRRQGRCPTRACGSCGRW